MNVEQLIEEIKSGVETIKNDNQAKGAEMVAMTKKIAELEKMEGFVKSDTLEEAKNELVKKMQENYEEVQKAFNNLAISVKHTKEDSEEKKTFKQAFLSAYEESKASFVEFIDKKSDKLRIEIKAVGNMSPLNFADGSYAAVTTETRPGIYQSPFSPLWLRNILPNASTSKSSIEYLQENGGEGAAAIWNPGTGAATRPDKPQVDYDFTLKTVKVEWIAGIVRIPREMLDDIEWLQSYVINQIIYGKRGILVAENALIIGTLDANSTIYDGTKTIAIEKLIDAAFGQLRDGYFNPTHILMNHRDMLNVVAFNKASTSGVYDIPNIGIVTVNVLNGILYIGGLQVVGVPNIEAGNAYVMDVNQTQFVSRMSPEVMTFEQDRDNVIKNLITIRAEERATALVFDSEAVIKVDITEPEPEPEAKK